MSTQKEVLQWIGNADRLHWNAWPVRPLAEQGGTVEFMCNCPDCVNVRRKQAGLAPAVAGPPKPAGIKNYSEVVGCYVRTDLTETAMICGGMLGVAGLLHCDEMPPELPEYTARIVTRIGKIRSGDGLDFALDDFSEDPEFLQEEIGALCALAPEDLEALTGADERMLYDRLSALHMDNAERAVAMLRWRLRIVHPLAWALGTVREHQAEIVSIWTRALRSVTVPTPIRQGLRGLFRSDLCLLAMVSGAGGAGSRMMAGRYIAGAQDFDRLMHSDVGRLVASWKESERKLAAMVERAEATGGDVYYPWGLADLDE